MDSSKAQARDLEKDLETIADFKSITASVSPRFKTVLTLFSAIAVTGWPYAIKRAQDAENEVDRLRNELNILQERMRNPRRYDV